MKHMSRLHGQPHGLAGLVVVLCLSLGFVWGTFGESFIRGQSTFWQTDAQDITQYMAGFNLYFSAPWKYPLLAFDSLNYPVGIRATFVDIIPLYALLLKLLIPASWAPFNPFGVWVAGCFVLQAVGAWWVARELRANSWAFMLSLAAFMLMTPALLSRVGHISLMSHWIVVFAIALYLRGWRLKAMPMAGWTFLLVSAFYINIYIFVMAAGIYAAAAASVMQARSMRYCLHATVPLWALLISLLLTLMPLPSGGVTREWGFGYYSMNVLSPLIGGRIVTLTAQVGAGQYEGFNYLGLGLIIALVLVCSNSTTRAHAQEALRRHWVLASLLLVYSVYALSNQIYIGSMQVATVSYPGITKALTSQFRVSGRFFWPVAYVLMIGAWWMLFNRHGQRRFLSVAITLTVVQLADLTSVYANLQSTLTRPPAQHLQRAAWDATIPAQVKTLYFYPKFKCGQTPAHDSLLPVMHYASLRGLNLNTGYISRYTPLCDDMAREIANSRPHESAYVFVRKEFSGLEKIRPILPASATACHEVDFAFICVAPR
jgi:hypothetical protein